MNCEIFISSKTTDAQGHATADSVLAREVHDYLTLRGHTVFLSTVSLAQLGIDAYKKAIDDALDSARVLIAVGTSVENLESQWVRYEWDSFFNDVLSGVKPDGHVFVYVDGIPTTRLPRALRQRHVFLHSPDSLADLGNFVRNALGPVSAPVELIVTPTTGPKSGPQASEVEVSVVAVGGRHLSDLKVAVDSANSIQSVFRYQLLEGSLADAVRLSTFRNIFAPDFFDAVEQLRLSSGLKVPYLIAVTDSSVSGKTLKNLFGSHRASVGLAVITTDQVPDIIIPAGRMAAYFVYYLARYALSFLFPQLQNHDDTRSCVFDRKLSKRDLLKSMSSRALCDDCRRQLLAVGGVDAAPRVLALDRLFMLSGDMLENSQ
jgi:hypothetical protein